MFTGTLRFNLDPTSSHSDSALWTALEHAHLKEHVTTLDNGLEHQVSHSLFQTLTPVVLSTMLI